MAFKLFIFPILYTKYQMESSIQYLKKPKINGDSLPYKQKISDIYVNLFEFKMSKPIKLYQYPFTVKPEIGEGDYKIRNKLFKYCGIGKKKEKKKIKDFYGECFISGDSLYAMKEINEQKTLECALYHDGKINYTITIQPKIKERTINQADLDKDPLTKQFIEMLIRDILHSNPKLEFFKGLFVFKDKKNVRTIESKKNGSITFYPGYTTSFMETEGGNYLNVTLKNKISSADNILKYLKDSKYENKENRQNINKYLIGKKFNVSYSKRNYLIDDIDFDKNPKTQTINYDDKTITLEEYYLIRYGIILKNLKQPLLVVHKKDETEKDLHFIPELCYLSGLDDALIKDRDFMKKLSDYTKLTPEERIEKTNEFLDLLVDPTKDEQNEDKLSAREKSELYGIKITPLNKLYKAYYMKKSELIGVKSKPINIKTQFDILSKKINKDKKWLCVYRKSDKKEDNDEIENTVNYFCEKMESASQNYYITISKPQRVKMDENSEVEDWTNKVESILEKGDYLFVVYLLYYDEEYFYKDLKVHSLCNNGYVSQIVKYSSLYKDDNIVMSICSKILLQINSKLSGVSYMLKMDKTIKDKKLMIIGVDSSHIKGRRTGVAMVATFNTSFTNFYNKELIINEETKKTIQFSISKFIKEALVKYKEFNEKKLPGGIIIYRQGVSFQQKEFLKNEVTNIQEVCDKNNLKYYYILVNTKTTYKFFERKDNKYQNPEEGLLVLDGVTNKNFFEFYIQPQKVTGGSATPTCFHVAYGNLDFPEIIPKLTFDLCHLYSNWQGAVRVPHVLKAAEKLSKMTAKYTQGELNEKLKVGQSYL